MFQIKPADLIEVYISRHGPAFFGMMSSYLENQWNSSLTNSKEHSPSWENNSHSDSQGIIPLLCNSKVHYDVQNDPSPVSNLRHNESSPQLPILFLSSMPRSFKWSLPFRFSDQNFACIFHLSYACYVSPHHTFLDMITLYETKY
jgi:hypothetical protein